MRVTQLTTEDAILSGLSQINVILGRNGAGKSRFLRSLDNGLSQRPEFNVRYISPERAGVFRRDANVQNNMEQNKDWLSAVRRKNQADNFKAASANLLRELEISYLRRLEATPQMRADPERTFRLDRLEKINRLLSNLTVTQEGSDLVFRNVAGEVVAADQISSGESETVALASEILYFFDNLHDSRFSLLLLDEPDVHLHPDLQARLARLVIASVTETGESLREGLAICIATHSTPLVCALTNSVFTTIGTKAFGEKSFSNAMRPTP
jgi:ATPase subunit of ABC transporter with duplicated ATPase domains